MNPFKKEPILIIEDDPDDQHLIKQAFKHLNIRNEVIFFDNGIPALEYLKTTSQKTFLILCDINMPMMDGLELRNAIIQNEYLKHKCIPFIFLSTASTQDQVKKAYKFDVQGFFSKNTSFKEFEQELNIILQYWKNCKTPNVEE